MAAPANDLFANARYIYDGIQFGDDTTGATLETGESIPPWPVFVTVGVKSVWYKWVAAVTGQASVALVGTSEHTLTIWTGTGTTADTPASITQATTSTSSFQAIDITVTAGVTYYFRVAAIHTYSTIFQLSYPVGRAPDALRPAGTNDLPASFTGVVPSSVGVDLMEAIGYAPDSELTTSSFDLLADDVHSESAFAATSLMIPNSDGSPAYSCERWVRLRFTPPFAAVVNLRFWVNNYAPNSGWQIYFGTALQFRKPSVDASDIANRIVPTADPGTANIGSDILTGGQIQYSEWLVVQAVWIGGTTGPVQTDPLNWAFNWTEI